MEAIGQSRSCAIAAPTLSETPLTQVRQGLVTAASVKRAAVQNASVSETPAKKYKQVDVLGQRYTALSWFVGAENPTPRQCKIGRSAGNLNALILSGGHVRAFKPPFTAIPPAIPQALCGDRERVGRTEANGVQIRRAHGDLEGTRLSQVLFSVADLEKVQLELGNRR